MAERKYCPLKLIKGVGFCEKERCAWWHSTHTPAEKGKCSILAIAVALHWISRQQDGR